MRRARDETQQMKSSISSIRSFQTVFPPWAGTSDDTPTPSPLSVGLTGTGCSDFRTGYSCPPSKWSGDLNGFQALSQKLRGVPEDCERRRIPFAMRSKSLSSRPLYRVSSYYKFAAPNEGG